jgi:hypothetical protein
MNHRESIPAKTSPCSGFHFPASRYHKAGCPSTTFGARYFGFAAVILPLNCIISLSIITILGTVLLVYA